MSILEHLMLSIVDFFQDLAAPGSVYEIPNNIPKVPDVRMIFELGFFVDRVSVRIDSFLLYVKFDMFPTRYMLGISSYVPDIGIQMLGSLQAHGPKILHKVSYFQRMQELELDIYHQPLGAKV